MAPRRRFGESWPGGSSFDRNTGRVEDALPRGSLNRHRVRRLLATNPYAAKARQTLLNNLIGFGIIGTPIKGVPKKVSEAWKVWEKRADWGGALDFYGLQDLATSTMLSDGDCFIVRRFDRAVAGVVPTRLEVLDWDMLWSGGGQKAIEYDDAGRPIKYRFRMRRDGAGTSDQVMTFDAKDVIHLFRKEWPGQTRGRSFFEPVLKRFEDMDEYLEAEVVRKKIEACFAAFITPSAEYAAEQVDLGGQTEDRTDNDFEVEVFEPGMIERLRPGDEVTFGDPKPSTAIMEFFRVTLLAGTAGVGVPYEHGTGDLSNVNYSSYRAGSLEFQRLCGRLQWLLIIPVMLERIWDWFLEDGYQIGLFSRRFYEIGWNPPAFESIDREKDARADILERAAGLTSHRKLVGKRGEDFDDLIAEIAEDDATIAAKGLHFTNDPRAATGANSGSKANASDD